MGRSGEDAAGVVSDRRNGIRPAGDVRLLLEPRRACDLRAALPVRLPRAAAQGDPEHRGGDARDLGGRPHWKIRIRPGIHFADDPAFKGKKRELVADDYVYSFKRLLDPRMRAPMLWFLDGKIVGSDDVLAKAKQAGRLDYDLPMEGLKALDRYTLQITLKEPDYVLQGYLTQTAMAAVAREVIEAYGDASGWAMANPVGTGPFRLKEWRRGQKIVLEANPNYREEYLPGERRARRPRPRREDEGQATAAARPHRHLDHRGVESAAPRVRERRARLRQRSRGPRRQRARPRQCAQARIRGQGRDAAPRDAAGAVVHVLQHGGSGGRRLHAGQDRAAPRDDHGLQHRGNDQGLVAGPGACRDTADSAGRLGPQPGIRRAGAVRPRRGEGSCSTSSATSTATRTACATCRTASRSPW